MPKFGKAWFAGNIFGDDTLCFVDFRRSIHRVILGQRVRKQLGKKIIFRIQPGTGYKGTEIGKQYQYKYKYVVPSSINNPQGQPARDVLKQAVLNWQTIITPAQKKAYNYIGSNGLRMSGYNVYVRDYMRANL